MKKIREKLLSKLLQTEVIVSNNFLESYLDLIIAHKTDLKQKGINDKHHIIPQKYYRQNNLKVDNSKNNIVYLSYFDHCLAHYYLSFCSEGYLKQANETALIMMVGRLSSEVEYQEFIELATQYSELRSAYVADKQKNRTGTTHSCETKDKISKSHLGVPMSDEARKKMSENHVDVNGKNNPAFGRHWYNNGVNRLYLKDTEEIPEGYIRGNLPLTEEDKKRKSESNKGKHGQSKGSHWYNNGEYEIMAFECPEGFVKGRLKK